MNQRTLKSLNKRLLMTQHLSKKASGPHSAVVVSEGCCGINSQDFRESFSSFWARTDGFTDDNLLFELRPRGGLARTWTIRGTVHIFPSKDYYIHVFGSPRKRILSRYDRAAKRRGIPDRAARIESLYQPLLDEIKGQAVTSDHIGRSMSGRLVRLGLKGKTKLTRGWSNKPTYGPSWIGITEMSYLGLLVNAGRKGSASLWMRTEDWLNTGRRVPDSEECVVELVRRYIHMYGPVTRSDIAYWSWLLSDEVDTSLKALKGDLVEERFEGTKETYYSLGGQSESEVEPPRAAVLPEFDSLMMGYRDKSRYMSQERVKSVFKSFGIVSPTILLDGFVAATWKRKKDRERTTINVTPLQELHTRGRRLIEERFAEYGDYLGTRVSVEFSGF